eukprot:scaffold7566_cov122-Isochrysis_galbana.AAC.1
MGTTVCANGPDVGAWARRHKETRGAAGPVACTAGEDPTSDATAAGRAGTLTCIKPIMAPLGSTSAGGICGHTRWSSAIDGWKAVPVQ